MTTAKWTAILALGVGLFACSSEPSKQEILFKVKAVDTAQAPVADVQFFINDDPYMFGKTNMDGIYEDRYDAKVGDTLRLRLVPPEGYQIIGDSEISMQVTEGEGGPLEVDLNGMFAPPKRDFLFVVEGRAGDRVIIENVPVYQIEDNRRGMFIHQGSPGQSFIVQVGDSAAYQWTYAQSDEIYLISKQAQHTLVSTELTPQKVLDNPSAPVVAVAPKPSLRIKSSGRARSSSPSRSSSRRSRSRRQTEPTPSVKVASAVQDTPPPPPPVVVDKAQDVPPSVEQPTTADPIDIPPPAESPTLVAQNSTKIEADDGFEDSAPLVFDDPVDKPSTEGSKGSDVEVMKDPVVEPAGDPSPSTEALLASLNQTDKKDSLPSTKPRSTPKPKPKPKRAKARRSKRDMKSVPVVGDPLAGMSKQDIKERVEQIGKGYDSSNRLAAADVRFLKQLSRSNGTAYNSAHRILGAYYYNIKEYRRQRDSLEIATKKGRYRSDAKVLLSLAQAYGHFKQYTKAIRTLKRTEAKMRRLSGSEKANVYRTYAEYARLYYIALRAKNPLRADTSLLDTAIQKWKRLQSISSAGSKDASDARKQIQKLEQMKSEAGMP